MKKMAFIVLILLVCLCTYGDDRNAAVILRILPLVQSILNNGIDIVIEHQLATSEVLGMSIILEHGKWNVNEWVYTSITSAQAGPQYRPDASYLSGFYIGAYPGVWYTRSTAYAYSYGYLLFSLSAEAGYQWISTSGLLLGASATARYYLTEKFSSIDIPFFSFNIHCGLAYEGLFQ